MKRKLLVLVLAAIAMTFSGCSILLGKDGEVYGELVKGTGYTISMYAYSNYTPGFPTSFYYDTYYQISPGTYGFYYDVYDYSATYYDTVYVTSLLSG